MKIKTPAHPKEGRMARLKKQIGKYANQTQSNTGTKRCLVQWPECQRPEWGRSRNSGPRTPVKNWARKDWEWELKKLPFSGEKEPTNSRGKSQSLNLIHLPKAFSSQNWKSESQSKDVEQPLSVEALCPCSHWSLPTSLSLSFLQSKSRVGNETKNTKDEFFWQDERTMRHTCRLDHPCPQLLGTNYSSYPFLYHLWKFSLCNRCT